MHLNRFQKSLEDHHAEVRLHPLSKTISTAMNSVRQDLDDIHTQYMMKLLRPFGLKVETEPTQSWTVTYCHMTDFILTTTGVDAASHRELENNDRTGFRELLRMTAEEFDFLLDRVQHLITKQNTKMRRAIPPRERLSLTLRFLATGEAFKSLRFQYRMGTSTISQ
ncbi:hypothetical protein F2P79_002690 [Pimephales promelas]|nr:hypothetical protein F2P79_002690 [Pimephales promelas]